VTNRECDAIFDRLVQYLSKIELGWIVQISEAVIEEGTIVTKSNSTRSEDSFVNDKAREKRKQPRATHKEMTSQERLQVLLESIDLCVVEPVFMKDRIATELSEVDSVVDQSQIDKTRFLFVDGNCIESEVRLDIHRRAKFSPVKLRELITEIKKEI
jgi:hypothetical protein